MPPTEYSKIYENTNTEYTIEYTKHIKDTTIKITNFLQTADI